MNRPLAALAVAAALAGCSSGSSDAPAASAAPSPTSSPTPATNGIADRPPAEILAAARKALASARSVHIKGTGKNQEGPYAIETRIKGTAAGRGTITIGGDAVEALRIGKDVYFKAEKGFWTDIAGADAATVDLLVGKYVKVSASNPDVKEFASITDPAEFGTQFLTAKGAVTEADTRKIGAVDAQGVRFTDPDGATITLYVATTGPAYPLLFTSPGTETLTLTFDRYDAPLEIEPPTADQVVEIPT